MCAPSASSPENSPKFVLSQPTDGIVQSSRAAWKIFAAASSESGAYLISRGFTTNTTFAFCLSTGIDASGSPVASRSSSCSHSSVSR